MKMQSKTANYWNESSKRIPLDKSESLYAVDKEKLFPRNSEICDIGGGTGADALYFLKKGHKVTLLDVSDYSLDVAKEKISEEGFVNSFQTQQVDLYGGIILQPDNKFDAVYSRLALHYFKEDTLISLYKEIYRILKSGGIATISIKSEKDEAEMNYLRANAEEIEPGIFSEGGMLKVRFTTSQLDNILKESGIRNFDISEYRERVAGRRDTIKSGNQELLLTDILIRK